jgi:Cu2+-exporting ATPase
MCCHGCKAVAEAIAGAGFADYYTQRTRLARQAAQASADQNAELLALDSDTYQRAFVRAGPDEMREVSLLLIGVTCAACVWLIEQRLQSLPGVLGATVNFATQRAFVRWDNSNIHLSAIVGALRTIGYDAEPFDPDRSDMRRRNEARASLWRLFVAAFGMMQVMMYAIPAYLADGDMSADIEGLMRWTSLILTLPVIGFSAQPFFSGALRDLRSRRVGMDVPVALGLLVTFMASAVATIKGRGDTYFDSIAMFVFLLLAARYLESTVRGRFADALERVTRLLPAFASRIVTADGVESTCKVTLGELNRGDRVAVGAGESVPADGVVEIGQSDVDESLLTGEPRGVVKRPGDWLSAGSINRESRLVMRVERVGADTVVAAIERLLERAASEKPRLIEMADTIAARFVTAILGLAVLAAIGWWFIDPSRALVIAVTLLVITCPCALSLATPAALAAASGSLTRLGVLIARGHALDTLARSTHFVFDKTGTLTTGELALVGVIPLGALDARASLAAAKALEMHSKHPTAMALVDAAHRQGLADTQRLADARDIVGEGVEASLHGRRCRIGRPAFVAAITGQPMPRELAYVADHVQVIALGDEAGWIALFTLADTVRPEARGLVRYLKAQGGKVALLTGDRACVAGQLAAQLDIDIVSADATPASKLSFVDDLQRAGAVVAMIGDGVNDAPVLAKAQVSIALGSGADVAQAAADIILTEGGLTRLQPAIETARRSQLVIKQNLAWAGVYNLIAIPAALLGLVTPLAASIGMALSSALVVGNALRAAHPVFWGSVATPRMTRAQSTLHANAQSA